MDLSNAIGTTDIFITGGTGYLGSRLIKRLLKRGYRVRALVRPGSKGKVPEGCEVVEGDALDAASYHHWVPEACTFIHLVGVAHPSPRKKELFEKIDLRSVQAATAAVAQQRVKHFVYVSVVQSPIRIMADYQRARAAGEQCIKSMMEGAAPAIASATFLRPWYVLGPGHWWPLLLLPLYWIGKRSHRWREKAQALELVWLPQMLHALEYAAIQPPSNEEGKLRVWEPRDISKVTPHLM